jgi:hypothetical protein
MIRVAFRTLLSLLFIGPMYQATAAPPSSSATAPQDVKSQKKIPNFDFELTPFEIKHGRVSTHPSARRSKFVKPSTFTILLVASWCPCRVAPASFPARALSGAGLGDFHHPALPSNSTRGAVYQSCTRTDACGSG